MNVHLKQPRQEPLPIVEPKTAIMLANTMQMTTRAWRLALGVAKFPLSDQSAVSIVAAQNYSHEGTAQTMETYKALALYLNKEKSLGVAERLLRKLQGKFVEQHQDIDDGNVHHWVLKDRDVGERLEKLANLLLIIHQITIEQANHPDDPEAGKDLLPIEARHIYFNIVGNRRDRLAGRSPT